MNRVAPTLSSDLAARFLGPAAQSKFESAHALRPAHPLSTVLRSVFSTARPERPNLAILASSFDRAKELLGSMTQPNRKRLNLATPAPSFRPRPRVFWARGSIEHRAHVSLAVHAALRPPCGVWSPQLDRSRRTLRPCGLVFSLGCVTKSLRLRDSPNRKCLGLPTLAPSFRSRRKVFGPSGSIKH